MSRYEFKVIPAPRKNRKLTDLTKNQDKFCATITDILTDMGLDGWEFVGAETLPYYQRRFGLFTRYQEKTCLVFRREIERLIEPQRLARPSAEVMAITAEPEHRTARPEMVAQFRSGARQIKLAREASDAEAEPIHEAPVGRARRTEPYAEAEVADVRHTAQEPMMLTAEARIDDSTASPAHVAPRRMRRTALTALERAIALDENAARQA
ncbi:MAG: hypothetical protein AAGA70_13655 [Pseudomonadota bacterium]